MGAPGSLVGIRRFSVSAGRLEEVARWIVLVGRSMKARDLATDQPVIPSDTPAPRVARLLADVDVRAVLVAERNGSVVGVISDRLLLSHMLPSYVTEVESLAGVLDERDVDLCWLQLQGKIATDLLPSDQEVAPLVDADATLIEVASTMVRARVSLVAVLDGGRLTGGITIDRLIAELLKVP
jgi:CBS domain-containing protein